MKHVSIGMLDKDMNNLSKPQALVVGVKTTLSSNIQRDPLQNTGCCFVITERERQMLALI